MNGKIIRGGIKYSDSVLKYSNTESNLVNANVRNGG